MTVSESTILRYTQTDPDVRLMLRVRDDDASAFEEIVRRYQPRLIRLMQHLAPHTGLAEDLVQETFMRVFRARHSYQPGAKFSTWLFTIAGNVARNAKRTQSRRKESSESDATRSSACDDDAPGVTASALDASGLMPTRQVESDERAKLVRSAVAALNERQRMALILSRFENMSYQEIADTMDLSTKAVKSLLSRARLSMKETLQSYIDEGVLAPDFARSEPLPTMDAIPASSSRSDLDSNDEASQ
ncbi:RNA polymerase sigma-70 factor, ECF subfamily [Neorhodopirellula lusitana]|uniref:RNA polymerase sigma factor n=1 Tax=Neorhodopirellula lusitana TaxID=445327 RepID=A0ABY1QQB9_9BACT|nr:sigma-70 family RNA polymerase sigma factor [Neorhodopirellula lusitana]SMP78019.1 RNA polymerase sigma-70 factor, ECF subfamily [Neorhodopirellula lusitana]